jgi:dipeptidase E
MKRLLLLSNSTNFGEPFLQYPLKTIQQFLGPAFSQVLFVPYAGVRISFRTTPPACMKGFRR